MVRRFLFVCEALPDLGHPDERCAGHASRDRARGEQALLREPAILFCTFARHIRPPQVRWQANVVSECAFPELGQFKIQMKHMLCSPPYRTRPATRAHGAGRASGPGRSAPLQDQ
jgi:hypothetical protein